MANSRYDYHKERERSTEARFNYDTYIIVRLDGDKFHRFCSEHNFHKPNDKRALDLMVESAKEVMKTYKGHIPLAYGHSDEFSFLIKSTSNMLSRRTFKITSMLISIFTAYYNTNWDRFFGIRDNGDITPKLYDAWFDAKPREYANYKTAIDYFRWRQIDCHINNLYNTTLHAMTGRYVRHEKISYDMSNHESCKSIFTSGLGDGRYYTLKRTPIRDWISDNSIFFPSKEATEKLSGTVSSDKHDIMFLKYKINYNNELEQFKKGTVIVDSQQDYNGQNADPEAIAHYHVDIISSKTFWDQNKHIFEDYVECPSLK